MILNAGGRLDVPGYIATTDIMLNNVGLQNTLNGFTTSISNINTTVASVITELTSVQDTFGNEIYSIKSTIPSFLQTTNFNSTINSYLTISNFTSASVVSTSTLANYSFTSITTNSLFMIGNIQSATSLSLVSNTTDGVSLF